MSGKKGGQMRIMEDFAIAAFRSRQHALYFSQILKREGYETQLISTPKCISIGCGLSLRFSPRNINQIIEIYRRNRVPIVGFYLIKQYGNTTQIKRISCD